MTRHYSFDCLGIFSIAWRHYPNRAVLAMPAHRYILLKISVGINPFHGVIYVYKLYEENKNEAVRSKKSKLSSKLIFAGLSLV